MKIESWEEKHRIQQFKNKCLVIICLCLAIIGYLAFQY